MYGHFNNYTHLYVSIISAFGSLEDIICVITDIRYTVYGIIHMIFSVIMELIMDVHINRSESI